MKPVVIGRRIITGLVATAALSAIMSMKQSMGLMPELDLIAVIKRWKFSGCRLDRPFCHLSPIWEVGFAIVSPYLPGRTRLRGPIFAGPACLVGVPA
jgi:hypothetical protein